MNNFFGWIKKHVRPSIGYDKDKNKDTNNESSKNLKDRFQDAKKNIKLGIEFTFKI